ncbi:TonB-dependent siderophore receptor [Pseudomonas stutzeri]|uniref:TonB-dependent receptor n=1 Tax=Stutzerimonas stutzeri TaxID=316 RepID=UPI002108BAA0|nr:TonB-dependent siderophore receptor [Stutzerimonas stutzeri]MCQ4314109.1 TonB-dependent siderophore receptor [Stutzerimonas stutzeri]
MSRPSLELSSNPRLLVSAIGVTLTALSAPAVAQDAEKAPADNQEPVALDSVTVVGNQEQSYKADGSASKKYTAPLRETPKSITVITDQVIRDTGALSLVDALRTTSGITFGAGEGGNPAGDRPIIRGFDAESDTFIDGLRDIGSQTREIFNIERIEVSKGPGSAYTGAGSTGGSLNLITKTAKRQNFGDASFTYGSDQTRRYTLDVNRVISDNVAGRLNLMKHEANVAGRDGVEVSRWGVAPTVTFGFDTPTRATLSYYHLETDDVPDYGIPLTDATPANPNRVPVSVDRDNFYGLSHRDYRESTTDAGTIRLEHDLNDNLTLSNTTRVVRTTLDYIVTTPNDSVAGNLDQGLVFRSPKSRNSTSEGWVNQTDLSARFDTGSVEHSVVTGVEISDQGTHNRPYVISTSGRVCTAIGPDCADLANPNYDAAWNGTIEDSDNYTDTDTRTLAAYVFDTLKFNEQWSLNLGLRYDDYETTSSGYGSLAGRGSPSGDFERESGSHFWNYQAGLVFNPLPNGSIYVAWSTSSNPVGESSGEGSSNVAYNTLDLEPERNRNVEIGTKWEFLDDRLGVDAAVFKTEKTNARVNDANGLPMNIGETEVTGFELSVNGQLTSKWQTFASYTYLDGELVKGVGTGVDDGNAIPSTPENSFSFWTTYHLLPQLTVGGGANYVDSRFGNTANTIEVPSYWRYDAMAAYRVSKNLDLQLNVQNLTDKRYFDQVYGSHMAHVAAGRTALLSTNFHF